MHSLTDIFGQTYSGHGEAAGLQVVGGDSSGWKIQIVQQVSGQTTDFSPMAHHDPSDRWSSAPSASQIDSLYVEIGPKIELPTHQLYCPSAANQSDYKDGPGLLRFAGPGSLNLAGMGHTQVRYGRRYGGRLLLMLKASLRMDTCICGP